MIARRRLALWLSGLVIVMLGLPATADAPVSQAAAGPRPSLTLAIERSRVAAIEEGAPEDLRLERFLATHAPGEGWRLDATHRSEGMRYRVWLADPQGYRVIRQDVSRREGAGPWAAIPPADRIGGLDDLILEARKAVAAAGFRLASEVHVRYRISSPGQPQGHPLEIAEVFVEVEGDTPALRAIFHDRVFHRLTPAKLLRVQIPSAGTVAR